MNTQDLLERRAERGTPRGAANVWADAQPQVQHPTFNGAWLFRFVVSLMIFGIGLVTVFSTMDSSFQTIDPTSGEPVAPTSSEPLPRPIFVDGLELTKTVRPGHPDFDADDLFGEGDDVLVAEDPPGSAQEVIVYATADDPFDNPIVAITIFDDGEFRTSGANLEGAGVDQAVVVDGMPTLPPTSGLVEVARYDTTAIRLDVYGWLFEFSLEDGVVDLRTYTSPEVTAHGEWPLIAMRLSHQDEDVVTTTQSFDVFDQRGIYISSSNSEFDDVIWESENLVYTLSSWGTDSFEEGRDIRSVVPQLREVDRTTWAVAVSDTDTSRHETPSFIFFAWLFVLVVLTSNAVTWLWKRYGPAR